MIDDCIHYQCYWWFIANDWLITLFSINLIDTLQKVVSWLLYLLPMCSGQRFKMVWNYFFCFFLCVEHSEYQRSLIISPAWKKRPLSWSKFQVTRFSMVNMHLCSQLWCYWSWHILGVNPLWMMTIHFRYFITLIYNIWRPIKPLKDVGAFHRAEWIDIIASIRSYMPKLPLPSVLPFSRVLSVHWDQQLLGSVSKV